MATIQGSVISCNPTIASNTWEVVYTYALDAGGIGQTLIVVGPGQTVAQWPTLTSTIIIPTSPGTVNQVQLSCPPIVQWGTFGIGTQVSRDKLRQFFLSAQ